MPVDIVVEESEVADLIARSLKLKGQWTIEFYGDLGLVRIKGD